MKRSIHELWGNKKQSSIHDFSPDMRREGSKEISKRKICVSEFDNAPQ